MLFLLFDFIFYHIYIFYVIFNLLNYFFIIVFINSNTYFQLNLLKNL